MLIALQKLLASSLLADVRTYDVDGGKLNHGDDSPLSNLAARAIATRTAELLPASPEGNDAYWIGSALALPIYRGGNIVSVAVLAIKPKSAGAGVFEIWDPVGPYDEVKLRTGYFAHLERFSNVSSFVRFERGNGLPGQVWKAANDGFTLVSSAYQDLPTPQRLSSDAKLPPSNGLLGLADEHGGATTTENLAILSAGRIGDSIQFAGGLAIPFYQGNQLTSVTTMLF